MVNLAPRFGARPTINSVKIGLTPRPEVVRHLGRQFPPFGVILKNKHHQIEIQRRKIILVQHSMEIFSEVIESLEAPWDLVLVSSNDFNQNNSRLRSWRKMMFNKKFALEKTYCIVGDVPQTIQNTYPMVSTLS